MAFYFSQGESFLLGSDEAIAELSQKEQAALLVVSDTHGAVDNLLYIVKECGAASDALLFLGDGVGDIIFMLQMASTDSALAQCIPPVIAFVQGNNDMSLYTLPKASNSASYAQLTVPLEQNICVSGHNILLTHGHRYGLGGGIQTLIKKISAEKEDILLYGHTHVAKADYYGPSLILNPGSASRPRSGQPPCYARISLVRGVADFSVSFFALKGSGSVLYNP